MPATSSAEKAARVARARRLGAKAVVHDPRQFWAIAFERQNASPQTWRRAFHVLVDRVIASPGVVLYDAVESGVPTYMVDLIAGATGEAVARVMDVIGVSRPPIVAKTKPTSRFPMWQVIG